MMMAMMMLMVMIDDDGGHGDGDGGEYGDDEDDPYDDEDDGDDDDGDDDEPNGHYNDNDDDDHDDAGAHDGDDDVGGGGGDGVGDGDGVTHVWHMTLAMVLLLIQVIPVLMFSTGNIIRRSQPQCQHIHLPPICLASRSRIHSTRHTPAGSAAGGPPPHQRTKPNGYRAPTGQSPAPIDTL